MTFEKLPDRGKLEDLSVSKLLGIIHDEEYEGCLTVSRGKITRHVYFSEGMVVFASSTETRDRLGEVFIRQGSVTKKQLRDALRKSRDDSIKVGMSLVEEGIITQHDLYSGVTFQVVMILDRIRSWRKGEFTFNEAESPPEGAVLLRLPLGLYIGATGKGGKKTARKGKKKTGKKKSAVTPLKERAPEEEETIDIEIEPPVEEGKPAVGIMPLVAKQEFDLEAREFVTAEEELPGSSPPEEEEASAAEEDSPADVLIREISFHVQELKGRDSSKHHRLLGVSKRAGKGEIQDAYHSLAKILHPDHHPPTIPQKLAREAEDIFKDVTAAFQALASRPGKVKKEQAPVAEMAANGAVADDEARKYSIKGKQFINKKNYWQAADALRQAVRLQPEDAAYRNLLGYALLQTGKRLHEAEEHLRAANRLEPWNADFLTNLGLVYKSGRLYNKAREQFKRALNCDQNYQRARQELDTLPRNAEEGMPQGKMGFIRKILGRG